VCAVDNGLGLGTPWPGGGAPRHGLSSGDTLAWILNTKCHLLGIGPRGGLGFS